MSCYPHKIITCRALAPTIQEKLGPSAPITILDIALHLQPDILRKTLLETIAKIEKEDTKIILGYGLCGRALEGVYSTQSTLVLPRVDDCVGMLLGSRLRHKEMMKEHPGRYWMEKTWLDTELNIFTEIEKGLARIPLERRKSLLKIALKHYNRLVLFRDETMDEKAFTRCRALAEENELIFELIDKDLGLIDRLLFGPWDDSDFIVVPPGTPISFF